jgi:hypothetical protein
MLESIRGIARHIHTDARSRHNYPQGDKRGRLPDLLGISAANGSRSAPSETNPQWLRAQQRRPREGQIPGESEWVDSFEVALNLLNGYR